MSSGLTFGHISTFIFDVDGVLTDGSVYLMPDFSQVRRMNIKDGYALQLAIKKGYNVWVVSGGNSAEVKERLRKLGVTDVHMGVLDKASVVDTLLLESQLQKEEVLFMGDDLPDLYAMQRCGMAVCPKDAAPEIREISHYISERKGGDACVREVIELVLRARGHWEAEEGIASR